MKLLTALLLIGCTSGYTEYAKAPEVPKFEEICIDGVVYLYLEKLGFGPVMSGYLSVKFNQDSEVVTCESEGNINEWKD